MQFSLNFVWKQAIPKALPEESALSCPIPDDLIANVENIARTYPELPINIWVDIYGIGNHPVRLMQALDENIAFPNIKFNALDSISAYTTNPLFEKPFNGFEHPHAVIWQQVDLARLYVLNHLLVSEPDKGVIYSDMDRRLTPNIREKLIEISALSTEDTPSIHFLKASAKLSRHGMVVGKDRGHSHPENQFIGFKPTRLRFLRDELVPKTAGSIAEGNNGWVGHARALTKCALSKHGLTQDDVFQVIPTIDPGKKIKKAYVARDTNPVSVQSLPRPL